MVTIQELKQQFGVRQVPGHGPCIVIPKGKFNVEWEKSLSDQHADVKFNVDLAGGICTLIKLKPEDLEERTVYSPPKTKPSMPISPAVDSSVKWGPDEDQLLISLWNQKLTVAKIYAELHKKFPKRTDAALKNRIRRLICVGKIRGRWQIKPKRRSEQALPGPPEPTVADDQLTKDVIDIRIPLLSRHIVIKDGKVSDMTINHLTGETYPTPKSKPEVAT